MTLPDGTRLGPYELLAPIGAGGMGEVYRARDTRLERTVAVKVLPSHLASSVESRQRFEREARTISQLSHPHICALYDVGREGDTEYLVMEYLEGETLSDRLLNSALSTEQVLRYGVEIADALDKAHRQGIVHRDLKPGNVMLTKSGVKLLDFGLAKAMAVPGTASGAALTALPTQMGSNLTQEGTILGTFQYMAPEQLEGKEADARTDIFAFGALLYEMATGKKAFSGESHALLISSIMAAEPPPVSTVAPMAPPALDRVVRRCLVKDPDGRWQSARDVAIELDEIARAPVTPTSAVAVVPGARRRDLAGWIAAGVLLALLLVSLLVPRRSPAPTLPKLRVTIPPPASAAVQGMLALSPDGRMLVFAATGADGNDFLYLRPLDSLESRVLPGTEGAAFPFWSPDSRSIGFFARRKLKRIDVAGGSPVTLCGALEPRGGSWGSRGTIIFSVNTGGELHRVPENGGQPTALLALTSAGGFSYRWPSFLPDGRHFLYFVLGEDPGSIGIHVASLDSQKTSRVVSADAGAIYAAPGFLLYPSGDRLMGHRFDADRRLLDGEAFPVLDHIWWDSIATGATAVSASNSGLLASQTGGSVRSRLLWYDRSGRELGAIGPDGMYWEPTLSPDDRWLSVSRMDPEKFAGNIWTIDLQRGSLARLSSRVQLSATSLWSNDGRRIVYSSFSSGEVFIRDAQGAGRETLLFKNPSFTPLDDWSRDGRYIFYEALDFRRFHFDVWIRDLKTATSRPLLQAEFNQAGARLSPDGRWLAYESDESGDFEVFVRGFPEAGERRQVSSGGGRQPRWRGDGRELFYVSPDRKIMSTEVRPGPVLRGGRPAGALPDTDPAVDRGPQPLRRVRRRPAFPRELAPSRRRVASDQRRRRLGAGEAQVRPCLRAWHPNSRFASLP